MMCMCVCEAWACRLAQALFTVYIVWRVYAAKALSCGVQTSGAGMWVLTPCCMCVQKAVYVVSLIVCAAQRLLQAGLQGSPLEQADGKAKSVSHRFCALSQCCTSEWTCLVVICLCPAIWIQIAVRTRFLGLFCALIV